MRAATLSGADTAREDGEVTHEAACLRPFCCNPFAAFSAFSRVGGWTPGLPEAQPANHTGKTGADPGDA